MIFISRHCKIKLTIHKWIFPCSCVEFHVGSESVVVWVGDKWAVGLRWECCRGLIKAFAAGGQCDGGM